ARRGAPTAALPRRPDQTAVVAAALGQVPAMTGTIAAAAELRAALEILDALIQVRLEERRGGPTGRTLSIDDSGEGLPPRHRFGGAGPLAEAISLADLTAAEAVVLTAAVAPYVDERFAALYGALTDRPGVSGLTGEVARTLAARSFRGRLDA